MKFLFIFNLILGHIYRVGLRCGCVSKLGYHSLQQDISYMDQGNMTFWIRVIYARLGLLVIIMNTCCLKLSYIRRCQDCNKGFISYLSLSLTLRLPPLVVCIPVPCTWPLSFYTLQSKEEIGQQDE